MANPMHYISRLQAGATNQNREATGIIQSYKVQITPLVIYSLRGGQTHTHIHSLMKVISKTRSTPAIGRRAPGLKFI